MPPKWKLGQLFAEKNINPWVHRWVKTKFKYIFIVSTFKQKMSMGGVVVVHWLINLLIISHQGQEFEYWLYLIFMLENFYYIPRRFFISHVTGMDVFHSYRPWCRSCAVTIEFFRMKSWCSHNGVLSYEVLWMRCRLKNVCVTTINDNVLDVLHVTTHQKKLSNKHNNLRRVN